MVWQKREVWQMSGVWGTCCKLLCTLRNGLWKPTRRMSHWALGGGNVTDECQQSALWSLLLVPVMAAKIFFPIQGLFPSSGLLANSLRSLFILLACSKQRTRAVCTVTMTLWHKPFSPSTYTHFPFYSRSHWKCWCECREPLADAVEFSKTGRMKSEKCHIDKPELKSTLACLSLC